jgi:hypothetical protein
MGFTAITVTHGPILNLDGSYGSGTVAFRLSTRITNGVQTYTPVVPVHATVSPEGMLSQVLPANNDPATLPAGSFYIVTFFLNGSSGQTLSGDEYEITVPYNAPGGTVDLGTLLPGQVGPSGPS